MLYNIPIFPYDLEPSVIRSLALLFVLQEFLACTEDPCRVDRLCFYYEILLQASRIQNELDPILLDEILQKRKKLDIDLKSKLISFFSKLHPFLKESKSDENVLFFLVEHAPKFNAFLGSKTIENLLKEFFPAGPHELRAVICEGYMKRGFHSAYLKQESMLDALEWES